MKKIILLTALLLALIVPKGVKAEMPCFDPCGLYVSTTGAANFIHLRQKHNATLELDAGYLFTGAVGYRFFDDFRVEAEFGYRSNDLNKVKFHIGNVRITTKLKGHVENYTGLANVYYDIPYTYYVRPYVGVGAGYAYTKHQVKIRLHPLAATHKSHSDGFAWQVIAGFAYLVYENVDLSLEYRFFRTEQTSNAQNHAVGLNLRYNF